MTSVDYYLGVHLFERAVEPIAAKLGFSVEYLKMLGALLVSFLLAAAHPALPTARSKHVFSAITGVWLLWFVLGPESLHVLVMSANVFLLLNMVPLAWAPSTVFTYCMAHLSAVHLYFLFTYYRSSRFDVTGALMMLVIKLVSLAFNYADGKRGATALSAELRAKAITSLPKWDEFFGFAFYFAGVLTGPAFEIRDYLDFTNVTAPYDKIPGGAYWAGFKKLLLAAIAVPVLLYYNSLLPYLYTDAFFNEPLWFRLGFVIVVVALSRWRYYFAWSLGEGAQIVSGLGYNGTDKNGATQWDRCANYDLQLVEFGANMKESTDNWNRCASRWLRLYVYDRLVGYPGWMRLVVTYSVSAFWHGFYPGYYLTALSMTLLTQGGRAMRKHLRGLTVVINTDGVEQPKPVKTVYDLIARALGFIAISYCVLPFIMLDGMPALRVYMSTYFIGHLVALGAMFLLPIVLPHREKRKSQ